jgi:ATP-dependent Clp protease protease subunit
MLKAIIAAIALTFCSAGAAKPAYLHIQGEIDDEMASGVNTLLESVPEGMPLVVVIDSPGGSVIAGFNIIESIREHGPAMCVDSGMAASMAGLIFESPACTERVMRPMSLLHFHLPSTTVSGNVVEIEKEKAFLTALTDSMYEMIARRAGIVVADQIIARVRAGEDVIFTANQALSLGLCDRVE